MLHRYRHSIYALTDKLHALQAKPEDLTLLLDLQKALLTRIKRTDARIAELKAKRKALVQLKKSGQSKERSKVTKAAIAITDEAISDAQQLLFLWRCFGDGIAFIYVNKQALKHMLYNTHDYEVKPSPGAILGKIGLRKEWSILEALIKKGIPAVLSDLTNTIRHGDICVLIGPDPIPVEVKTSKNSNARVDRQIASLTALNKFFRTDAATNFRGLDHVVRLEIPMPEGNHADAMNECIERSRETGFAALSPEQGLTYVCVDSEGAVSQLGPYMKPKTILTILNEMKTGASWMPYFPFVLSIRRRENLFAFMNGDITLMILIETQAVVDAFAAKGLAATFVEHPQVSLVVTRPGAVRGQDPTSGISTGYFARLFYDFETLQSFVDTELAHITYMETPSADLAERFGAAHATPENPTPVEWLEFRPMVWPDSQSGS
ncbi:hypothetical protein J2W39_000048 [Variovorax paradoxus]|uniref:Uncharacterized protein n=1 Tax=Variovorax paradoxus TaxID=34073 RepID=A0AAW8E7J7_VARPD|nr:hypothetical protein [Variovorax paradoxus]MDP9968825.1 hypothetical protein [Variovorax paradoxus]